MGTIKKILFRMKKVASIAKHLTLSTTSTSATWSPLTITNTGATLTWDISGDIAPTSQNVDDPTFDLSANTGTVNMDVYDVSGLTFVYISGDLSAINIDEAISLVEFNCNINTISTLNVSNNTLLEVIGIGGNNLSSLNVDNNLLLIQLICQYNSLPSLNTSNNTDLQLLYCDNNNISSLDLSTNTLLNSVQVQGNNMLPSVTDQIYIDLANGNGVNGDLKIRNNRTSASDTARTTLISRGWTINESYTT